jgi:hypothetical protein
MQQPNKKNFKAGNISYTDGLPQLGQIEEVLDPTNGNVYQFEVEDWMLNYAIDYCSYYVMPFSKKSRLYRLKHS